MVAALGVSIFGGCVLCHTTVLGNLAPAYVCALLLSVKLEHILQIVDLHALSSRSPFHTWP